MNTSSKIIIRLLQLSSLLAVSIAVSLSSNYAQASAASTANFNAGHIIDDRIFTDTTTMNVSQIQAFLNSKVVTCDTNGTQPSEMNNTNVPDYNSDGTIERWEWGKYNYNQTTFPCLKDYTDNGISSAQIIYNAAQKYQINPEVLVTLLQKEQGLVTDTWPLSVQYRTATGYGCPDTASCDTQYYGLTNQINWAATMYRAILNQSSTWYSPYVLGDNYIQWSPDSSCGGSTVYIDNLSTVALYDYTPYQPNQASLDAGYGGPVTCGSYGNRNFYLYFNDWFGPTTGPPYAWQLSSQEAYSDSAMTKPANLDELAANTTYYFRVRALNIGNKTWTNSGSNPILLGTTDTNNRDSAFCNSTWVNCERPALLQEASVPNGSIGTFTFSVTTPSTYGTFNEHFNLVAEGASWFNDFGMYWPLTVTPPTSTWRPIMQQVYLDSSHTTPANVNALSPNTTYYASVQALNTGNTTWTSAGNSPVRLGTSSPQDRSSAFSDSSWISPNRAASLQETSVVPGGIGTFNFTLKSPSTYGTYKEYFRPVVEGSAWMNDAGMYWPLSVIPPTPLWSVVSQQAYTDSTMTSTYNTSTTSNGSRYYLSIKARNIGNTTWTNSGPSPVRLGTNNPQDRASSFYDSSWLSPNRPAQLQESSVAPGQIGTFNFWVQAPYELDNTTLKEYFRPVVEGVTWMNDIGMYQPFTFSSPTTAWQYVSQNAYTDSAHTTPASLSAAQTNTKYYLVLKAKNTSGITWSNSGANPLRLGTSSPNDRTSAFYDTSWLTQNRAAVLQESTVAPGSTGTFSFIISTPSTATSSNEYFTPLVEGRYWLTDLGVYWTITTH